MGLLAAVVMTVLGLAAGIGAGVVLAPPGEDAQTCEPATDPECDGPDPDEVAVEPEDDGVDYVKLTNQFVVPIVQGDSVRALVVVSLTLEVAAGAGAAVFDREPRLRDSFLQQMFDFAYTGGFDGPFTQSDNLAALRRALKESAQRIVGPEVREVLIVDIVRQEM